MKERLYKVILTDHDLDQIDEEYELCIFYESNLIN